MVCKWMRCNAGTAASQDVQSFSGQRFVVGGFALHEALAREKCQFATLFPGHSLECGSVPVDHFCRAKQSIFSVYDLACLERNTDSVIVFPGLAKRKDRVSTVLNETNCQGFRFGKGPLVKSEDEEST